MKCLGCGYVSFDVQETCKRCGAPMSATAAGPPPAPAHGDRAAAASPQARDAELSQLRLEADSPEQERPAGGRTRKKAAGRSPGPGEEPDDDAFEVNEADLDLAPDMVESHTGPLFTIDEDLLGAPGSPGASHEGFSEWADRVEPWQPFTVEMSEPALVFAGEEQAAGAGGQPVINRDEEVPERYWAPEIAGLGRRTAALVVDQAILALLLGGFFAAAFLAFRLSGFDTGLFLSLPGLQAALLPFALLAILLGLAYQAFFHGYAGRTPGKAFACVEVRTGDGAAPSWRRLLLRWSCAVLGLAAAGIGLVWPLVEPRRRGWADLLSGTVIARHRRDPAGEDHRR